MQSKIPYLARVRCAQQLFRFQEKGEDPKNPKNPKNPHRYMKGWRKSRFRTPKPFDGVFLGYRTVQTGYTESDYDMGLYFVPKSYRQVGLVTFSSTQNPVYVELDDIEVLSE